MLFLGLWRRMAFCMQKYGQRELPTNTLVALT